MVTYFSHKVSWRSIQIHVDYPNLIIISGCVLPSTRACVRTKTKLNTSSHIFPIDSPSSGCSRGEIWKKTSSANPRVLGKLFILYCITLRCHQPWQENRGHFPSYQSLVGGFNLPLWKIWVRQIGSSSQLLGKIKAMFQTTNQTWIYRAFSSYVWWPEIPPWPCRWSPAAPRRCSFRMVFGGGDALKGYRYYKEWYRYGLDMDFMTLSESWSLCFTNRAKHVNAKLRV